jgi:hypothetical protein
VFSACPNADIEWMRFLIGVLAIVTSVVVWQWWSDRSTESTLTPVASAIAGRDVHVDCQTLWGALIDPLPRHGEVRFDASGIPEDRIFLTHDTCDRLAGFADRSQHAELSCLRTVDWSSRYPLLLESACYREASPTFYALLTLAHEAYHTAGIKNEATANCYATQAIGYAALALGSSDEDARFAALEWPLSSHSSVATTESSTACRAVGSISTPRRVSSRPRSASLPRSARAADQSS